METVPFTRVESEISDKGTVTLLIPRHQSELAKKFFKRVNGNKYVRVDLDEIGSKAWQLIDGSRSVGEIASMIQEDAEMEQAEARMQLFIRALSARKYVDLFIIDKEES